MKNEKTIWLFYHSFLEKQAMTGNKRSQKLCPLPSAVEKIKMDL